ncbi:unnamed protein product [Sphagnum compactum]
MGISPEGQSSDAPPEIPKGLGKKDSMLKRRSEAIQLFEAPADSDWFHAIEARNCKLLLELFQTNRSLWVQTGLKGRSVLHVAVMQGCSELVKQLHDYQGDLIPRGENWETPFEFLWENAKDGRLKDASARDMWIVMEGLSVEEDMKIQPDFLDLKLPIPELPSMSSTNDSDVYRRSHVTRMKPVADDKMLRLRDVITSIAKEEAFVMDETDVDFNFEDVERKELYVHMACSRMRKVHSEDDWESFGFGLAKFMIAAFTALDQEGNGLLKKLFDQRDAQGRTILQIFVLPFPDVFENIEYPEPIKSFCETLQQALRILPKDCVNVLDKAGRTLLHWAIAHNSRWAVGVLQKNGKTEKDLTFQTAIMQDITAFHLQLWPGVDYQTGYFRNLKKEFSKQLKLRRTMPGLRCFEREFWDPTNPGGTWDTLEWAILMGRKGIANGLLKQLEAYGESFDSRKVHVLLMLAAFAADRDSLQKLLGIEWAIDKLNIGCDRFEGMLPLAAAVASTALPINDCNGEDPSRRFDRFLHCNDFMSIALLEKELDKRHPEENKNIPSGTLQVDKNGYEMRTCVALLLQAGADILATSKTGDLAEIGISAPDDIRTWWYDLVDKQIAIIKGDLKTAATATAVVSALVATSSFVGPAGDIGADVTRPLIRMSIVCNNLSFYLAISSVMLSLLPSLPVPKEGLMSGPTNELIRSRKVIVAAIATLFIAIISEVTAFSASSIAGIPLEHRGLIAYSTSIGGLVRQSLIFTNVLI